MALQATGLIQAIDNRGYPYPAIRARTVQFLATAVGSGVAAAALQPQTKVVRITVSTDSSIAFPGGVVTMVAPGNFQDFIVYPGDTLTVQALTTAGFCSIAELM